MVGVGCTTSLDSKDQITLARIQANNVAAFVNGA